MRSSAVSHFAAEALELAALSQRRRPLTSRYFRVGGASIELRFASSVLERLFAPSFVERTRGDPPDLVVSLWDPASLPDLPPLPWDWSQYRACGEIASDADGVYVHIDVPTAGLTISGGEALYWNRRPDALPSYEFAGPLRSLLHRWAIDRGAALVHAGGVALDGRGALIIGEKGAGKSTTCLSCVAAGFDYIGDDRCLVADGARPTMYNVFSSAKVHTNEVGRFAIPGLEAASLPPVTPDDKKTLLYMDRVLPGRVPEFAALSAIVLPRRVPSVASRLVPISPAIAIRHLVAEIVGHAPSTAVRSLSILRSICAKVPVYRLEAGSDSKKVAAGVLAALTG